MGDNGDKQQENKIIFQAELDDNKNINVKIFSNYVPIIAYAFKLLSVEIDKMIIDQRFKNLQGDKKIIKPHNIINFIRGRNA